MLRAVALAALLMSAALPAHALVIVGPTNGVLTTGDATQTGRPTRTGVPSTWAAPKAFPGMNTTSGTRRYDLITISFPDNALQDVFYEINLEGLGGALQLFGMAYINSFNPANLSANYLGDRGSSTGAASIFQVVVPTGGTLLLQVHDVDPGVTTDSTYTYTVSAFSDANRGENFVSVSEPATLGLMGLGLAGLAALRRRRAA
jgi:hypothetical protein